MQTVKFDIKYQLTNEAQKRLVLDGCPAAKERRIEAEIPLDEALARKVAEVTPEGAIRVRDGEILQDVLRICEDDQDGPSVRSMGISLWPTDHVLSADEAVALWRENPEQRKQAIEAFKSGARFSESVLRFQQKQQQELEREAAVQAEITERATWISAYGSDRLKRMLAEKIEHMATYRSERLALERPSWVYATDQLVYDWDTPRNPPESAFQLLDKAREVDPTAELIYWSRKAREDEYSGESVFEHGYAAKSAFLDKVILLFKIEG